MVSVAKFSYKCTQCGTRTAREKLIVKKAVFLTMGSGGRTVRSRVKDWLCAACLAIDNDFNIPELEHNKEVRK